MPRNTRDYVQLSVQCPKALNKELDILRWERGGLPKSKLIITLVSREVAKIKKKKATLAAKTIK